MTLCTPCRLADQSAAHEDKNLLAKNHGFLSVWKAMRNGTGDEIMMTPINGIEIGQR